MNAPYDQYVTPTTRFWHASGIDVSLSASGLSVQTESLVSILIGGIAFETPATRPGAAAGRGGGRLHAVRGPRRGLQAGGPRSRRPTWSSSTQPVRGLAPGAPVEFRGIPIGEVVDVTAQLDPKTFEFSVPVTLQLDAERFGVEVVELRARRRIAQTAAQEAGRCAGRARGSRAASDREPADRGAVRGARLLSRRASGDGGLVAAAGRSCRPPPDSSQAIEASVASIIKKIDEIPFKEIGDDLRKAIVELDAHARERARNARRRQRADRAELRARPAAGQHAPGGERRGPRAAPARGLSRASSRGVAPGQDGGGEVMATHLARWLGVALVAAAAAGCGTSAPSRFYTLDSTATANGGAGRRATASWSGRSPCRLRSTARSSWSRSRRTASRSTSSTAGPRRSARASRAPSPATSRRCSGRPTWPSRRSRTSIRPIGSRSTSSASTRCRATRSSSKRCGPCAGPTGGQTRSGRTLAREAVHGQGFDALAAAHSRALAKLSGDIAAAIRAAADAH